MSMNVPDKNKTKDAFVIYKNASPKEKKVILEELIEEAGRIKQSARKINDLVSIRKKEQEIDKKYKK